MGGGRLPNEPKNWAPPMENFGPSHRVKKKDLKSSFRQKAEKYPFSVKNSSEKHHIRVFLPETLNFSCLFSFCHIYAPKRVTFFTVKWLRSTVHDPLHQRRYLVCPRAVKNLTPPPSEFSKLTHTHAKISCPRMIRS